jgi:hypothetical protein
VIFLRTIIFLQTIATSIQTAEAYVSGSTVVDSIIWREISFEV